MKKLKVLSLFSGIGGIDKGLEDTGLFSTIAFVELDPHCQKVLKKHWPKVPIYSDIKKLSYENFNSSLLYDDFENNKYLGLEVNKIDVIVGGFPCTSISIAGKKRGLVDKDKSGLWYEYERIIREVSPKWVIIENVRNLLNIGMDEVLKGLDNAGYNCEWQIISARSIGANHLRERIWIVAWRKDYEISKSRFDDKRRDNKSERAGAERVQQKEKRDATNSDLPRFWPAFATEEEKSEWWAKTTAGGRDWWEAKSEFRGVDDGLSEGLDRIRERERKERIKMLGNSVVPQIPYLIGLQIAKHEGLIKHDIPYTNAELIERVEEAIKNKDKLQKVGNKNGN